MFGLYETAFPTCQKNVWMTGMENWNGPKYTTVHQQDIWLKQVSFYSADIKVSNKDISVYWRKQSWGGTRTLSVSSSASASLPPQQFLCPWLPSPTLETGRRCDAYTPELYCGISRQWKMGTSRILHDCEVLKLPQVCVQVFHHPVLVLNHLEYDLQHVRAVTVSMRRVWTCTSTCKHLITVIGTTPCGWFCYITYKFTKPSFAPKIHFIDNIDTLQIGVFSS